MGNDYLKKKTNGDAVIYFAFNALHLEESEELRLLSAKKKKEVKIPRVESCGPQG